MLPSGPAVIPVGWLDAVGTLNSVTVLDESMVAILLAFNSVNHTLESGPGGMPAGCLDAVIQTRMSGPTVMPFGALAAVGTAYSVHVPVVVPLPTWLVAASVNQSRPSAPVVMPVGELAAVGTVYSVMVPLVVILAILF